MPSKKPATTETPVLEVPAGKEFKGFAGPADPVSPAAATVTASQLVSRVEMPPVSENAIAAIESDTAAAVPASVPPGVSPAPRIDMPDNHGTSFDPTKHKQVMGRDGRWINLKTGRPKGSGSKATSPVPVQKTASIVGGDTPAGPLPPAADPFDASAELYCRTFYAIADMIFKGGGEWQPSNESEHKGLKEALAQYMRVSGLADLPPGWSLTLVAGTFAACRLQMPNTQKRINDVFASFRTKKDLPPVPVNLSTTETPGAAEESRRVAEFARTVPV